MIYDEGLKMDGIAALFGLSRQWVAVLLGRRNGNRLNRRMPC